MAVKNWGCESMWRLKIGVLSQRGGWAILQYSFENSTMHNYVPFYGRDFILHLDGSCHTFASMCVFKNKIGNLFQLADIWATLQD